MRHEIVHNRHVVESLRHKGAVFVDELADVPKGAVVIFSAHGVSPAVRCEADARGLRSLDATCPLVTKVHLEALRYARDGYTIVLVVHRRHVEVIGTLGEAPEAIVVVETREEAERLAVPDPNRVAYITQTTLSVDDVSGRELSRREVGGLSAGRHVVTLGAPGTLAPGIYLGHLIQGDRRLVARAVVVQ